MPKYFNPHNETLMLYNERGGDLWVAPLKERTKAREAAGHKFIVEGAASHFDRFVKAGQLRQFVEAGEVVAAPVTPPPLKAPMGALAAESLLANKVTTQEAPKEAAAPVEKSAEKPSEKSDEQKSKYWDKKQQKH